MAEFRYYDAEIADEIAEVIGQYLGTSLRLEKCEAGLLNPFPAPEALRQALNAVFVLYIDVDTDDLIEAPKPQGFEAVYQFDILYLRKQLDSENSDSEIAREAGQIAALFLNAQRKLPSLNQPGCRVIRCLPKQRQAENEYNDMFDVPELGINVAVIRLFVYTRMLPA